MKQNALTAVNKQILNLEKVQITSDFPEKKTAQINEGTVREFASCRCWCMHLFDVQRVSVTIGTQMLRHVSYLETCQTFGALFI
jgi:hypothetical protein